METSNQPDLYYQLVYTLTGLSPPPLDDTPEAMRTINHAAVAKVAALLPVNANEADLASFARSVAQCITAAPKPSKCCGCFARTPIDRRAGRVGSARRRTVHAAGGQPGCRTASGDMAQAAQAAGVKENVFRK
jgi:hypothetical protein